MNHLSRKICIFICIQIVKGFGDFTDSFYMRKLLGGKWGFLRSEDASCKGLCIWGFWISPERSQMALCESSDSTGEWRKCFYFSSYQTFYHFLRNLVKHIGFWAPQGIFLQEALGDVETFALDVPRRHSLMWPRSPACRGAWELVPFFSLWWALLRIIFVFITSWEVSILGTKLSPNGPMCYFKQERE